VKPNVVDILSGCHLFSQVPESGFQRLAAMARIREFPKGKTIFREGDDCPGTYVLHRGRVRVFKIAPNGKEHVLHVVEPGYTFAEVAAMGDFACPASAEALTEVQCLLLPSKPFRRALDEDHSLCRGMLTGLTFWVRQLVGLLEDIVLRDAAGRVAQYLLQLQADQEEDLQLPALKRHLASHLNLTSETFSRTVRRLVDGRLIVELDNSRVRLLDPEGLRRIAEGMFPTE
jgi:CRP/FNR family transcriptional regulator